MAQLPSRFRRLDQILADLPVEDPLLLAELDGYLTAIAVSAEPMLAAEWLPPIWGGEYGEAVPFEDPIDAQLFADMMVARLAEIGRDLGRGKLKPLFDVDRRKGEVVWEDWMMGFAMAMDLRPDDWDAPAEGPVSDDAAARAGLVTLVEVASDRSELTADEINAVCDGAAAAIPKLVTHLHALR
jgi:uncharacterized protein